MGNAIVKFDDAFEVDLDLFEKFKLHIEETLPHKSVYSNEDGSMRTEGGYEISNDYIKYSPIRYTNLHTLPDEDKNFIEYMKQAMHKCVIEYCKIFPVVIENIRWVTNGYVIKYENGQCIGPHSDCNIAYAEDNVTVINSIPVNNVLTIGAFLNDDFDNLKKELGDVLWFVAVLGSQYNLDMLDIAVGNINKLRSRAVRNVIGGSGDDR